MTTFDFETWRSAFLDAVQEPQTAASLKGASLAEDLKAWTACLTATIAASCRQIGWQVAARGHRLEHLPQAGQEYLGIDVMAFPQPREQRLWPMPVAAFELENDRTDERVAYSLWKVLCIRAPLRVVIAYRPDWEQSRLLIVKMAEDLIGGLTPQERTAIGGETVIVIGNRGEGETFPWGYFKFWKLDANLGRFERV